MAPAKNFDTEDTRAARLKSADQRAFILNGTSFVHRVAVPPEVLSDFRSFENGDGDARLLEILDAMIPALLEPDSAAKWPAARSAASENPITLQDMLEVGVWLAGITAGRPTEPSSDSSESSTEPGTPSTDATDGTPVQDFGG